MKSTHFIDTNILLYSISGVDEEAAKMIRAREVLRMDGGALSVQVLQEFYVQATRSNRSDKLSHDVAASLISTWLRFVVADLTLPIFGAALEIKSKYAISYWDSAIIAAAASLGCGRIYSEDLQHGQTIAGVQIVNPFI